MFSSTASSLVATHLKVATGKVGINLNVFGPDPVAHLLGGKFITILGQYKNILFLLHLSLSCPPPLLLSNLFSDSLVVGSLPRESCTTRAPDFAVRDVSFTANDHKLGVMMSSFNQRRSKMDGTGAWHLSELILIFLECFYALCIPFFHCSERLSCDRWSPELQWCQLCQIH